MGLKTNALPYVAARKTYIPKLDVTLQFEINLMIRKLILQQACSNCLGTLSGLLPAKSIVRPDLQSTSAAGR